MVSCIFIALDPVTAYKVFEQSLSHNRINLWVSLKPENTQAQVKNTLLAVVGICIKTKGEWAVLLIIASNSNALTKSVLSIKTHFAR